MERGPAIPGSGRVARNLHSRAADRAPAWIAVLLAVTSATFPRRRLVHGFTKRFRGNATLGRGPAERPLVPLLAQRLAAAIRCR